MQVVPEIVDGDHRSFLAAPAMAMRCSNPVIQPSGASAAGNVSCHVGSTRPTVTVRPAAWNSRSSNTCGKGRPQASDDEVILGSEVAPVARVAQDGERVLPAGMQIEVAALPGAVGLQAPEVVVAVDTRAGQGADEAARTPPGCRRPPQS